MVLNFSLDPENIALIFNSEEYKCPWDGKVFQKEAELVQVDQIL